MRKTKIICTIGPANEDEEVLEKMGHPLGKLILNYRGIAKLLNTYIDKMPAILNKKTGRIHCSFNQYGTDCIIGDSHLVTNEGVFTFKELLDDLCIEEDAYYVFKKQILNKDRQWEDSAYAIHSRAEGNQKHNKPETCL